MHDDANHRLVVVEQMGVTAQKLAKFGNEILWQREVVCSWAAIPVSIERARVKHAAERVIRI